MVETTPEMTSIAPSEQRHLLGGKDRWTGLRNFFLHPVVQNIGIWMLALAPFVITALNETYPQQVLSDILRKVIPACIYFALPIYTHGFFIAPLLYKRNYGLYLVLFTANVLFWSAFGYFIGDNWMSMRGNDFLIHTVLVGGITFFGALIKIAKDSILRNHRNRQAELRLLRTQLNPHFLFNTLNNLYGLAVQKSDNLPNLMLQLSDLLRYSLYETREGDVPLDHELQYINNYVELERIRLAERADIELITEAGNAEYRIAPMLLIVFIENCFKHLNTKRGDKGLVQIHIRMKGATLLFHARNSKFEQAVEKRSRASGIGLTNVRKRLQLLYPRQHQLDIKDAGDQYEVYLKIDLA